MRILAGFVLAALLWAPVALAQPQRVGPLDARNNLSELAGNGPTAQAAARANLGANNASNLNAGTVPPAQLPLPTLTTVGGVLSVPVLPHQWVTYIDAAGLPHTAQPAYGDIAGLGTAATQPSTAFDAAGLAAAEQARATGAETTLTTGVGANAAAITSEATTARTNEAANASAIAAETTARGTAMTGEATARASGDATNATAIASEAATRAAAVTGEATARASGDATNATAAAAAQATANLALPIASAGPLATQAGATSSAAIQNALGFAPYSVSNPSGYVTASGAASAAPVQSVAGRTGTITLSNTDIAGFATAASAASPVQSVAGRGGNVVLGVGDVSGAATAASVTAETSRATGAETTLTTGVSTNATAISAETTRATGAEALAALKGNNLSDLASASSARTNLGLGTAATQPTTAFDAAGLAATASAAAAAAQTTASAALPLAGGTMTGPLHLGTQTIDGSAVGFTGGTESGLTVGANIATPTGANTALTLSALAAQQGVLLDSFKVAGDADDTASMTRAVAAGVPILLGPRTYTINNFQTGTVAKFILKGIPGASIIQRTSASSSQFFSIGAAIVSVDGVTFDMNSSVVTANQWGVYLGAGGQNISISHSVFKNNSGSLGAGLVLSSTGPAAGGAFNLSDNEITNTTWIDLALLSISNGVVKGNYIHDTPGTSGVGVGLSGPSTATNYASDIVITSNRFARMGVGVGIGGAPQPYSLVAYNPYARHISVSDNDFLDITTYGVNEEGQFDSINHNHFHQSSSSQSTAGFADGYSSDALVENNVVEIPGTNTDAAIDFGGCHRATVRNNVITVSSGSAINIGGSIDNIASSNHIILTNYAYGITVNNIESDGLGNVMPDHDTGTMIVDNTINLTSSSTGIALLDNAGGDTGTIATTVKHNHFIFTGTSYPAAALEFRGGGNSLNISDNDVNGSTVQQVPTTSNGDVIFDPIYYGDGVLQVGTVYNIRSFIDSSASAELGAGAIPFVLTTNGGTGYTTATTTLTASGTGSGWTGSAMIYNGVILGVRTKSMGTYTGSVTITATSTSGGTGATFTASGGKIPYNASIVYSAQGTFAYYGYGGYVPTIMSGSLQFANGSTVTLKVLDIATYWAVAAFILPTFAIGSLPTCNTQASGAQIYVSGSVSGKWQARCNATNWIAPDGTTIN